VCRAVALTFLIASSTSLLRAQRANSDALLFPAARSSPDNLISSSSSSLSFDPAAPGALDRFQPPPRRYGRPNFSDKNSNPDGSAKYTFFGGIGAGLPIGDTHKYETPNYGFQAGGGRNFNKTTGLMLQFDYDHFGLQASTIANQTSIYDTLLGCSGCVTGLDGNNHIWSFTLDPTFTLASGRGIGAYAVVGGGYYHKVTNFTQPTTEEECSIYGCGYFSINSNIDHYTSNTGGVNGGFGLTYKFSEFSTQRFYLEARYVLLLNQQRTGITIHNAATAPANATNFYPANSNRTTYIPIKLGLRF
jgi:hypothetical protein